MGRHPFEAQAFTLGSRHNRTLRCLDKVRRYLTVWANAARPVAAKLQSETQDKGRYFTVLEHARCSDVLDLKPET